MKRKQLKLLSVLITLLFIAFLTPSLGQAKEKPYEAEAYTNTQFSIKAQQYLWMGYSKIKDNGNGTVTVSGYTRAYQDVDIISLTLKLQVYDGGTWKTVKTWTHSDANSDYVSGQHIYPVEFGRRYRIHGIHEIWHNGTYESATTTTGWIIP